MFSIEILYFRMEEILIFFRTLTFLIFTQKILNSSVQISSLLNAGQDPPQGRKHVMVVHNIPGRMIDDDPACSPTGVDKPTLDPTCDRFDNTAFDTPLSYCHHPMVDSHITTYGFRGECRPCCTTVRGRRQWKVPWFTSWFTTHLNRIDKERSTSWFTTRLQQAMVEQFTSWFPIRLRQMTMEQFTSWFTIRLRQTTTDRFTQWLTIPFTCFHSFLLLQLTCGRFPSGLPLQQRQ